MFPFYSRIKSKLVLQQTRSGSNNKKIIIFITFFIKRPAYSTHSNIVSLQRGKVGASTKHRFLGFTPVHTFHHINILQHNSYSIILFRWKCFPTTTEVYLPCNCDFIRHYFLFYDPTITFNTRLTKPITIATCT